MLASQNKINFEFVTSPSAKSSIDSSTETIKEMIIENEIQHQFDLVFKRKFNKFEKDIVQDSINSINYIHEVKCLEIQINKSFNILQKRIINLVISPALDVTITKKRKKYIIINDVEADFKRSFKISFLSISLIILLFCMIFSLTAYFNFTSAYHSNYFKHEGLFKWQIVYSKN